MLNKKNIPSSKKIFSSVKRDGYILCENIINKKDFNNIQSFWISYFKSQKNNYGSSSNIHGLGQSRGLDNYYSTRNDKEMFVQRYKDFLWNKPLHEKTRVITNEINKFRNKSLGLDELDGFLITEKKDINFNQVNRYPMNGWMARHSDTKKKGILLNCMFPITLKNVHYDSGGLFLYHKNKEIDIDSILKPGSVLFYNGNLKHEVKKIKSNKNDSYSPGRIAGYPMKQFFIKETEIPYYIRFLIQVDIVIRRSLGLITPQQGNSSIKR